MTDSVNKFILLGHLEKNLKIRVMPDGSKMASFSVATSERWKDKTGEDKSITEWHRIVVFSPKLAETLERILKKGKRVYVEESHRSRKWIDKEGASKKLPKLFFDFKVTSSDWIIKSVTHTANSLNTIP